MPTTTGLLVGILAVLAPVSGIIGMALIAVSISKKVDALSDDELLNRLWGVRLLGIPAVWVRSYMRFVIWFFLLSLACALVFIGAMVVLTIVHH